MKKRQLANLEVPAIGMGSAQTFNVEDSGGLAVRKTIIDNCLATGTTLIDTSPMYGRAEWSLGISMEGRTQQFQLATKVWCSGKNTGKAQIARSFELLKVDHIHVFQIHNMVDWKTHLPYLEQLKYEEAISLIGVTYTYPPGFPEMQEIMKTGRIQTIQISYNVMEREAEEIMLPLAAELGIGVIVMRPLGSGNLAKDLYVEPNLAPLKEFGITTWAQALLAWALAEPRIGTLIPSTTNPDRILQNAHAGNIPTIPSEIRDYIGKEAERCVKS